MRCVFSVSLPTMKVTCIEPLGPGDCLKKPQGKSELPGCITCLGMLQICCSYIEERLDTNVNGLLNVICNHSFHCECHQRWKTCKSCEICDIIDKVTQEEFCIQLCQSSSWSCSSCNLNENLWICLICAYIGCSRYTNRHSYVCLRRDNFDDQRNITLKLAILLPYNLVQIIFGITLATPTAKSKHPLNRT